MGFEFSLKVKSESHFLVRVSGPLFVTVPNKPLEVMSAVPLSDLKKAGRRTCISKLCCSDSCVGCEKIARDTPLLQFHDERMSDASHPDPAPDARKGQAFKIVPARRTLRLVANARRVRAILAVSVIRPVLQLRQVLAAQRPRVHRREDPRREPRVYHVHRTTPGDWPVPCAKRQLVRP